MLFFWASQISGGVRFSAPGSAKTRRRLRRHRELATGEEDRDILVVDPHHYDKLRLAQQREA